jgi:hypothetical protein
VGAVSYRWEFSKDVGETWANTSASGYKTATLTVAVTAAKYAQEFRCKVTASNGTVYTNTVKIVEPAELSATVSPASIEAAIGESVQFTAAAENAVGEVTYRWEFSKDDGATWANTSAAGCRTATVTIAVTAAKYNQLFRCKVTADNGTVYTEAVKVTEPAPAAELTASITPETIEAAIGESVQFTAVAENAVGEVSYRWEFSKDDGATWANTSASGCRTETVTIAVTNAKYAQQFRCKVTADNGTVYTNAVKIVEPAELTASITPETIEAAIGDSVEFTAVAENAKGEVTYRWEFSKDDGETWANTSAAGCRTETVTIAVTNAKYAQQFRCKVTADNGTVYTNAVKIVEPAELTATATPETIEAEIGDSVQFTAVAENAKGEVSFRWQFSKDGGETWANTSATGYKTDTITVVVTNAKYAYLYRCTVTADNGTVFTNAVNFTKPAELTATATPETIGAAVGDTVQFTAVAENAKGEVTYRWQFSKDGGETWANTSATGYKTDTITIIVTNAKYAYLYRCTVTAENGVVETNAVKIVSPWILDNVQYEKIDAANCRVIGYTGTAASVVIPTTVEFDGAEYTVTEIGEEAFMGNTSLSSIDLPNTITAIRARAFKNCTSLSEMKNH